MWEQGDRVVAVTYGSGGVGYGLSLIRFYIGQAFS